jgi:hypothetical protein
MGKREFYILVAGIGVEAVAVGVGVMVSPSWGWAIAGFGGGIFIVFILLAVKAKTIGSPADILARIEHRKGYLPQLQDSIDRIILRKKELEIEASKTKLSIYYDLYIKNHHDRKYRFYRKVLPKDMTIITMLVGQKFSRNNPYLSRLEEEDEQLHMLYAQYEPLYTQNNDRILRKNIRKLWTQVQKTYSLKSMVSRLRDNGGIKSKYISRLYEVEPIEDERLYKAITKVKNRIDELLNKGVPDE